MQSASRGGRSGDDPSHRPLHPPRALSVHLPIRLISVVNGPEAQPGGLARPPWEAGPGGRLRLTPQLLHPESWWVRRLDFGVRVARSQSLRGTLRCPVASTAPVLWTDIERERQWALVAPSAQPLLYLLSLNDTLKAALRLSLEFYN